ncbi:MAG TPA: DUF655 domain-containing protein, partial [Candidatus Norongarragalinales archaeon]|nr:DUF655 domain-containing protein [Candidatus Norongarragalinales archaeon]
LYFTLLEATVKPDAKIDIGERAYIGRDSRDKITHIRGRIQWAQMTTTAQREAETVVRSIVGEREKDFVLFLNRAGHLSLRTHALEHLPNIGKKHLENLLAEREKKPFESFADVEQRVPHLTHLADSFAQRILRELSGTEKYFLFVKAPAEEREGHDRFSRQRR